MTFAKAQDAIDEMYAAVWIAWQNETVAVTSYVPEMRWQGKEQPEKPSGNSKFWARTSYQVLQDKQATLSNCVGEPFKKRYTTKGLILVDISSPKGLNNEQKGLLLAEVVKKALRKPTPNGVTLLNARVMPMLPKDDCYRHLAIANFEYDEIG